MLLDRTSRRVGLTAAGREFLGHAERVLADLDVALASVRTQVTVRLGFSWLLPDPWARHTVTWFEQATGGTVTLVRSDDPLAAVEQAAIDVAVVRGPVPDRSPVRQVHLFDEVRVAVCSERSPLAGRGIGVVPDLAMRRNIHPAVRFIPLRGAPPSPVSLAFLPHRQEPLMRQFVAAAVAAAAPEGRAGSGTAASG